MGVVAQLKSKTENRLGRSDLALLFNVSAEFAYSLDRRTLPDRARSAVFSSIPDAVLVSGAITGEAAELSDLEAVKSVLPTTPVLANTGVKHATVKDVLKVADGCIVGSSLKVDGNTWNAVDPARADEFMRLVRRLACEEGKKPPATDRRAPQRSSLTPASSRCSRCSRRARPTARSPGSCT